MLGLILVVSLHHDEHRCRASSETTLGGRNSENHILDFSGSEVYTLGLSYILQASLQQHLHTSGIHVFAGIGHRSCHLIARSIVSHIDIVCSNGKCSLGGSLREGYRLVHLMLAGIKLADVVLGIPEVLSRRADGECTNLLAGILHIVHIECQFGIFSSLVALVLIVNHKDWVYIHIVRRGNIVLCNGQHSLLFNRTAGTACIGHGNGSNQSAIRTSGTLWCTEENTISLTSPCAVMGRTVVYNSCCTDVLTLFVTCNHRIPVIGKCENNLRDYNIVGIAAYIHTVTCIKVHVLTIVPGGHIATTLFPYKLDVAVGKDGCKWIT